MKDTIKKAKIKSYWVLLLGILNLTFAIIILASLIPLDALVLVLIPQFFLFMLFSYIVILINRFLLGSIEEDLKEIKDSKETFKIIASIKHRSIIGKYFGYSALIFIVIVPLLAMAAQFI